MPFRAILNAVYLIYLIYFAFSREMWKWNYYNVTDYSVIFKWKILCCVNEGFPIVLFDWTVEQKDCYITIGSCCMQAAICVINYM